MDYRGGVVKPALLLAFFLCIGCSQSGSNRAEGYVLPEEVKWIHEDTDIAAHLTQEPAECSSQLGSSNVVAQVKLGRLAFRSPYLLGGQATRQGLSCQSCHTNGGVNRDFFIHGMSDAPGTADVTNFHFSSTLGDEVFNPKPIPSLVSTALKEDRQALEEREAFILRLVEKEFDGKAPSKAIREALVSYVHSLNYLNCSSTGWEEEDLLRHQLSVIDTGVELLEAGRFDIQDDRAFVSASLRNELGRLSVRYPEQSKLKQKLVDISLKVKQGDPASVEELVSDWAVLRPKFEKTVSRSLYNKDYVLNAPSRD